MNVYVCDPCFCLTGHKPLPARACISAAGSKSEGATMAMVFTDR